MNDNLSNTLATLVGAMIDKSPSLLEGARMYAAFSLVIGFICFGIVAGFIYIVYIAVEKEFNEEGSLPFFVLLAIFTFLFGIIGFIYVFDSKNWVGLFHPDIYLLLKLKANS